MKARPQILKGRLIPIINENHVLYDNIDTDMIYHNAHLAVTDIALMGKYAFGNLDNWQSFGKEDHANDILVVGRNFGAGSSRQHAVDCFISMGVLAIIAESFGAIYKRNAINSGFPIIEAPDLVSRFNENKDLFLSRPICRANLAQGELALETRTFTLKPFSQVQMAIYQAGSLFDYGKSLVQ